MRPPARPRIACDTSAVQLRTRLSTPAARDPTPVVCLALSLAIGGAVVSRPSIAFLIVLLPVVALMATRSATVWVVLAVFVAVAFRGLAGLHVAPGYGQFAHIPLAWGALAVALSRGHVGP